MNDGVKVEGSKRRIAVWTTMRKRAGLLAMAMLAAAPAGASAHDTDASAQRRPVEQGTVTVKYAWSASGITVTKAGRVPSNARVTTVYLAGAPTGDAARVVLEHQGHTEAVLAAALDGTVSYPTAEAPSYGWQGHLVRDQGRWLIGQLPAWTNVSVQGELTLVINWVAEASEAPGAEAMTGAQDVDTALRTASSVSTGTEPTANAGPSGEIDVQQGDGGSANAGPSGEIDVQQGP